MRNQTWILGSWILLAGISLSVAQEIRGLGASGPTSELAQKMMLFGQFVGDWECDVVLIQPEGSKINGSCEWLSQEDEKSSCCTEDGGRPSGAAL
jgi:hypothetical protein